MVHRLKKGWQIKPKDMKIIIPIADTETKKNIADSFHNTEFACIYNTTDNSVELVATKNMIRNGNLETVLRENEINAVISKKMPLMALGFFTDNGLTVYKAESSNIEENIDWFLNRRLKPMTNASVKISSDCSGSCGSCHTTCKS